MIFSTIEFAVFMALVFLLYWSVPARFRWILLLLSNIWFYACYEVKYLIVLLLTTVISYVAAILIEKQTLFKKKKGLFVIGIVLTLSFLLVCKYLNFTIYAIQRVLSHLALPMHPFTLKLLVPVGISFYTFEMVSYLADVYSGKIPAERNFFHYAVFVSFFPNISSGPIERAGHFLPQLKEEKRFDYDTVVYGTRLLLLGLVKKIVIADMLSKYVDAVFEHVTEQTGICFLWATLLYTFQIYCDFSGYSDMAVGLAGMLGFELPRNFKGPYLASSVKEFWSRWHISLSTWLRDYIYIPLGGNKRGSFRRDCNLLVTFLISGLWHGASFTFIFWGFLHGIYQITENHLRKKKPTTEHQEGPGSVSAVRSAFRTALGTLVTFCLVSFAWLFFRARAISEALFAVTHMFSDLSLSMAMARMGMTARSVLKTFLVILFIMVFDIINEKRDVLKEISRLPAWLRWTGYFLTGLVILALSAHNGVSQEFIYFRF
ncbi:MAG: MBOAT family protein [Lachnospiraceae bacterium]|nr:MBOAT family protein [Lachnospiraceae bacterium]